MNLYFFLFHSSLIFLLSLANLLWNFKCLSLVSIMQRLVHLRCQLEISVLRETFLSPFIVSNLVPLEVYSWRWYTGWFLYFWKDYAVERANCNIRKARGEVKNSGCLSICIVNDLLFVSKTKFNHSSGTRQFLQIGSLFSEGHAVNFLGIRYYLLPGLWLYFDLI